MALTPQIAQIKSSGTYRFEFDKSQTVSIPAEQIRLLVGFSKKGPFNSPVYIPDTGFFTEVYGEIDRGLERKASYFHRTGLAMLERGPILALNLLRLNNDITSPTVDEVEDITFSTSATAANTAIAEDLYSGFYNTERFWFPDAEYFLGNISATGNKLFNLVSLGNKPVTCIVRKAQALKGFDVTVKEWYGMANIPEYLHKDDYISDFFIDVIVIDGDFGPRSTDTTPYERFSADPLFASYFDSTRGILRKTTSTDTTDTALETFLNKPEVNHIATYTGCLLPDFIDLNGNNLFIQDVINADTAKTGLFCAVNKEPFDSGDLLSGVDGGLDLIGHNLEYEQPRTIDFLSYSETIVSDLDYDKSVPTVRTLDVTGITPVDNTNGYVLFSGDSTTDPNFYATVNGDYFEENVDSPRTVGTYVLVPGGDFVPVVTVQVTPTTASFEVSGATASDFSGMGVSLYFLAAEDFTQVVDDNDGAATGKIEGLSASDLYEDAEDGIITRGDKIRYGATLVGSTLGYLDVALGNKTTDIAYKIGASSYTTDIADTDYPIPYVTLTAYEDEDFDVASIFSIDFTPYFWTSASVAGAANELVIQTQKGALNHMIPATATSVANEVTISNTYSTYLAVGKYLLSESGGTTGPSRLTRITKIVRDGVTLTVTTVGKILLRTVGAVTYAEVYTGVTEWVDYYQTFCLHGFTHGTYHLPDGTQEQQDNILSDTLSGTSLFNALIDKDSITYRYIIDSFGLGIQASSKRILSYLAYRRQNALAILNAPSLKDFKNSTNPYFTDLSGAVSSKMISEGGDLSKNPSVVYTLPSVNDGSSYCAFYGPYLTTRDRGKNLNVPPAGYVSNNFIDKYVASLPWSIVAGARRGVIGGRGIVGLETNLSKDDRDYLEPFGINPIIFQNGTGLVIFGNKTSQQNIKSALSSVHVREVLIYIQDGIAAILKSFNFEYNTPQIRLEIKTLADNFMNRVRSDNGVYDFRNIMDETNNTSEVIDANIGILDTYVEPTKGLEILVHRTTILKTGSISTGQFL